MGNGSARRRSSPTVRNCGQEGPPRPTRTAPLYRHRSLAESDDVSEGRVGCSSLPGDQPASRPGRRRVARLPLPRGAPALACSRLSSGGVCGASSTGLQRPFADRLTTESGGPRPSMMAPRQPTNPVSLKPAPHLSGEELRHLPGGVVAASIHLVAVGTRPFSEHPFHDFGGATLGLAVVLIAAAIRTERRLVVVALLATWRSRPRIWPSTSSTCTEPMCRRPPHSSPSWRLGGAAADPARHCAAPPSAIRDLIHVGRETVHA